MTRKLLVITILVAACAAPAFAEMGDSSRRAQHWDFSVQTRYTASQDYTNSNGTSLSLSDDLGWGFGFGYNASEKFNVGFVMAWRSVSYDATSVDATDPDNTTTYSNWLDTGTFALTADWNILPKKFTPYVNGALGWTMVDTNISAGYSSGCWWDPWYGYVCSSYATSYGTDAFSYAIGAGLRMEMSEAFFLKVGYEYDGIDLDSADGFNIFRVDAGITY